MKVFSITPRSRRLGASLLTLWLVLSPTGLVGAAIQPTAAGNLALQGSALAAGRDLALQTSGDLQLLAAYSQSRESTQRTTQGRKKLETLNFELEQNRVLLATLTAGNSIDLNVGGNVAAQIGSMDSSGNLQADRMTATGVIKGSDRQQVSLTHTSDKKGTTLNGPTSKVLGNLAAQGIRSGANDSFAPEALQSGQAAVTALMQNGLLTITNQPAIQAALSAPTPNGGALTFKDDSGRVTLTLAGEAKVQAVYNQLKLTETFDVKHFADQGTAQVVTLVAAIALTVMSGGTGAAMIGATAGTASAAAANAAFIAMASTMTGQLAAGASFDEAFQVALKAGVTSAVSAGIASGIDQYVNGVAGSATPTTIQSGTQTVQSGTHAAAGGLSNLDRLGTAAYWQQTTLNATAQGTLASLQGGSFKDGFAGSVVGSLSVSGAGIIGDSTAGMPLANIAAHAVLGCASAAAGGKDCAAGAIGGAGSATVARLIDSALADTALSETTKNAIIASGSVAGSMAIAGALGKDVITAGNAAGNEVLNNYLKHTEVAEMIKKLESCKAQNCSGSELEGILGNYRRLSASRSAYDLLDSEIAADVMAGEKLMAAYMQTSGSFRINSTINALFAIDREQASIARNVPTVQAVPSAADNLKTLKAQTYEGMQAQNLTDSVIIASPVLVPLGLARMGTMTVPYLTNLTGLSGEALAVNSAFGAGMNYLSAQAQGKSDSVTTAMTAWGAVQPMAGAMISKAAGGTWSAEMRAGFATGALGNYLTQRIEINEQGKPFSYRDLFVAGGLGAANALYGRSMVHGLPIPQAQSVGAQVGINVSNPVPWIDLTQSKAFEVLDAAKNTPVQGGKQ